VGNWSLDKPNYATTASLGNYYTKAEDDLSDNSRGNWTADKEAIPSCSNVLTSKLLFNNTDKLFYRDRYDVNRLLGKLGRLMASTYDLTDLSKGVLGQMISNLKATNATIVLTKGSRVDWSLTAGKTGKLAWYRRGQGIDYRNQPNG